MVTSHILKFVGFTKTQKSRYLENIKLFFLRVKKSLITHQGLLYGKHSLVAEETSNFTAMVNKIFGVLFSVLVRYETILRDIKLLKGTLT